MLVGNRRKVNEAVPRDQPGELKLSFKNWS
jgi:hypothetical protein